MFQLGVLHFEVQRGVWTHGVETPSSASVVARHQRSTPQRPGRTVYLDPEPQRRLMTGSTGWPTRRPNRYVRRPQFSRRRATGVS